MSRTYRTPCLSIHGWDCPVGIDEFNRTSWLYEAFQSYKHYVAKSRADGRRYAKIPAWYRRQQNRRHRAAMATVMRHWDSDTSQVVSVKRGWGSIDWL